MKLPSGLETRTYQNQGYFKVQVSARAVPVAEDAGEHYDVVIKVLEEGQQYRMADLRIINMTVFPEEQLRDLFPISRGEIFSKEQAAKGLEELRRLYGSQGYLNFTAVPNTVIDDDDLSIGLEVDVDEGKQFRLRSVEVLGVNPETKARVINDLAMKPGDVYNSESWERSIEKFPNLVEEADTVARKLDERGGWVDLVFDFRKTHPCPVNQVVPPTVDLTAPASVH